MQTGPQSTWRPSTCCGMADCARVSARFGSKFSKIIFRGRKIFGPNSRAIAPKSVISDAFLPCIDAKRSARYLASIKMTRYGGLRAFFGPKFSNKFRGRKNLRSEISCDRTQICDFRRLLALYRCKQVCNLSVDHQHAAAWRIARVFRRDLDRNFRKRFAAANFSVRNLVRSHPNP